MRELLIATSNEGKLREIKRMLEGTPFTVLGLGDLSISKDVDEVGTTFESNSIIKALTYGKWSGKLTLSEDSGLEIDALGGWPGVNTKPETAHLPDNGHAMIIGKMEGVPEEKRTAQFHSVITIYDPKTDKIRLCQGIARGKITHEPIGTNNMAQDPIFRYDDSGKTGGEMTVDEKNAISHRSKAFAHAKEILLSEFV